MGILEDVMFIARAALVALILIFVAQSAFAQMEQSPASPQPSSTAADDGSPVHSTEALELEQTKVSVQLPTSSDRFRKYLRDAYGPVALFRASFGAGFSQATERPAEWGSGLDAYGRRWVSHYGELVIQETTRYGIASASGEDIRYQRCNCAGALPRIGHALLSTVTARARDGGRRLSVANTVAPFVGSGSAVAAWYPDRFGPRDGLRFGGLAFAGYAGTNILREFLPIK
jgi:hypothetical protein